MMSTTFSMDVPGALREWGVSKAKWRIVQPVLDQQIAGCDAVPNPARLGLGGLRILKEKKPLFVDVVDICLTREFAAHDGPAEADGQHQ